MRPYRLEREERTRRIGCSGVWALALRRQETSRPRRIARIGSLLPGRKDTIVGHGVAISRGNDGPGATNCSTCSSWPHYIYIHIHTYSGFSTLPEQTLPRWPAGAARASILKEDLRGRRRRCWRRIGSERIGGGDEERASDRSIRPLELA